MIRCTAEVQSQQTVYPATVDITGMSVACLATVTDVLSYIQKTQALIPTIYLNDTTDITSSVFSFDIDLGRNLVGTATLEVKKDLDVYFDDKFSIYVNVEGNNVCIFKGYVDGIEWDDADTYKTITLSDLLRNLRDSEYTGDIASWEEQFSADGYVDAVLTTQDIWLIFGVTMSVQLLYPFTPGGELSLVNANKLSVLQDLCKELCASFYVSYDNEEVIVKDASLAPTIELSTCDSYRININLSQYTGVRIVYTSQEKDSIRYEYELLPEPETYYEYGYRNNTWTIISKVERYNQGNKIITVEWGYDGDVFTILRRVEELKRKLGDVLIYGETKEYNRNTNGIFELTKRIIERANFNLFGHAVKTTLEYGKDESTGLFLLLAKTVENTRYDENCKVREVDTREYGYNSDNLFVQLGRTVVTYRDNIIQTNQYDENGRLSKTIKQSIDTVPFATIPVARIVENEHQVLCGDSTNPLEYTATYARTYQQASRLAEWLYKTELHDIRGEVTFSKIVPFTPGWYLRMTGKDEKIFVDSVRYRFRVNRDTCDIETTIGGMVFYED